MLHSLDPASKAESGGWFGSNSLPKFDDLIQVRTLDPNLLPTVPLEGVDLAEWKKKRLIVVGDVHGCKEECGCLLRADACEELVSLIAFFSSISG